eukprot:TRINITY_DN1618_c0_g3_i3.p1 TRINITY_DN1618_c0_g3~~TRINITY_DN1618_c0_g3_i3.p1  ORF type:complete len:168 (+),score=15.26 TRINITY_DN1618_c0_g3_i3:30-506(+)
MASAVFILDLSGKLLICRDYRGDVKLNMAERFVQKILDEDEVDVKPVMNEDGITYSFVKYSGLILLAATRSNANVTSILLFLYHLIHVSPSSISPPTTTTTITPLPIFPLPLHPIPCPSLVCFFEKKNISFFPSEFTNCLKMASLPLVIMPFSPPLVL